MMRAEAAVSQLISSDKIKSVKVVAKANRNVAFPHVPNAIGLDSMWSPWNQLRTSQIKHEWIAAEIKYNIEFESVGKYPTSGTVENIFYPFSLQTPFRFEYELDKIILQMYLGHICEESGQLFQHSVDEPEIELDPYAWLMPDDDDSEESENEDIDEDYGSDGEGVPGKNQI
ncbi:hypothetical protein FRC09_000301 [Ceratobasidium sp. 395]|nr:hypothetical protein FRC09_000301 [Ceratobasidium sp. 395]